MSMTYPTAYVLSRVPPAFMCVLSTQVWLPISQFCHAGAFLYQLYAVPEAMTFWAEAARTGADVAFTVLILTLADPVRLPRAACQTGIMMQTWAGMPAMLSYPVCMPLARDCCGAATAPPMLIFHKRRLSKCVHRNLGRFAPFRTECEHLLITSAHCLVSC